MNELPIQHHPTCDGDRCETCLNDCIALTDYLFERTGLQRQFHDMLGEYRSWLDREGIPAESKHGWPMPQVFKQENVEAFITHCNGDGEKP